MIFEGSSQFLSSQFETHFWMPISSEEFLISELIFDYRMSICRPPGPFTMIFVPFFSHTYLYIHISSRFSLLLLWYLKLLLYKNNKLKKKSEKSYKIKYFRFFRNRIERQQQNGRQFNEWWGGYRLWYARLVHTRTIDVEQSICGKFSFLLQNFFSRGRRKVPELKNPI